MKIKPYIRSQTLFDVTKSEGIGINEVMETIPMTNDNYTDRTEPVHEAADEEDLLSLFDQYSDLMSPLLN